MVVFAEQRVGCGVRQRVVHPAHIPLEGKPKPTAVKRGHIAPRGGFLRDHHHIRIPVADGAVQFAEKGDCFQIPVVAVNVWRPLAGLAVVIEIQHGSHGIHPQPVRVILLHPEQRVGNEKALHLLTPHVKTARAPVFMFHAVSALIFVKGLPVKLVQSVRVFGEMGGHPVQDHADARGVHFVHKCFEVGRRAEARRRRKVSADLIPPRPVKRVLHHRHQLHVGIAHLLEVRRQLLRRFAIGVGGTVLVPPPGAEMHLVDVDWLFVYRFGGHGGGAVGKIPRVPPGVAVRIKVNRCGFRRLLAKPRVRVGFVALPVFGMQLEFVKAPFPEAVGAHIPFPDPAGSDSGQRIALLPAVEIANGKNRLGVRRPDADSVACVLPVHAEIVIRAIVGPLMKEVRGEIVLLCHASILSVRQNRARGQERGNPPRKVTLCYYNESILLYTKRGKKTMPPNLKICPNFIVRIVQYTQITDKYSSNFVFIAQNATEERSAPRGACRLTASCGPCGHRLRRRLAG